MKPIGNGVLLGTESDAGRDWGLEEKGTTEDEMAGWHHRLDGHESEWSPGVGDGQGDLVCCDSWVAKSRTWLRNWTELVWTMYIHAKLSFMCSSYCSWNFIRKQTLFNRDSLLTDSLSSAIYNGIHLANHLFLLKPNRGVKGAPQWPVWCAYTSRLHHPCFCIHNSPTKKNHPHLCSVSLY